jgi:hypothetical protein
MGGVGDALTVELGDDGRVEVEPRPVEGGPAGEVARGRVGIDGTVEPSSRATAPAERRATPEGATRRATRPTAPNANPTLAVTPTTQNPVSSSTRLTSRLSPTHTARNAKGSARATQLWAWRAGRPAVPPSLGAWSEC